MKLSLKKAIISAVVVLAGVSLFMPIAGVFAVAQPVQLAPSAQQQAATAAANQAAAQKAAEQKAAQDKAAADAAAKQQALDAAAALQTTNQSSSSSSSANTADDVPQARCEAGALGWILCPVIKLGQEFVGSMEKLIVKQLDTGPIQTTGRYENLHKAWAAFRDLANVFFIIVFIVIIFAQALSIKMDSYSIKMMLPRLIIAAIAIQFSFFIMQIGVDISNVVGNGIANLFSTLIPLGPEGAAGMSNGVAFGALTIVGIGGGMALGTSIVGALAVPALLVLLAAAISILGVFITVWLRVLVLQFLIILAPLAIVAWIMPNTEKWFTAWRVNVVKLLLMYPIIVFMISAGAMATHITAVSAEDGPFAKILAACVPIIIFLMIPAAIKASGSLMAMTGNFVMGRTNNLSKSIRSSGLMSDAKANVKKRAGVVMSENAKNADGINTFGQKAKAKVRRSGGRMVTGNAFSIGKAGQVKMAKTIEHAHHEVIEENMTYLKQDAMTNPELLQISKGLGDHSLKEVKVTNGYGKSKTVKVDHSMAEAAATLMLQQQGMVEFSELLDGEKNADGTQRTGTGLFDHQTGQWRTKGIQETMNRAIGPNAGKVLEKVTHAVHLQGDQAYGAISGAGLAGLGAGSGITAAEQGVKWDRVNSLNAMISVINSGQHSSTIQNDVAKSMRRELLKAYEDGKFEGVKINAQKRDWNVDDFLKNFIDSEGHVQTIQGDIIRTGLEAISIKVAEEKKELNDKIKAARKDRIDNPDGHH